MQLKENKTLRFTILIILASCLLGLQLYFKNSLIKPPIQVSKQERSLNFDEDLIKTFNLGQGRLVSSLLWIHTLMESDLEHYKKKDLNSWIYLRFKSIVTLEPKFYQAYLYGGQYLSVVKDDIYGARELLNLGLEHFETDFWLNFYAGFNYYFELGDTESAFKNYGRIVNHPLQPRYAPYLPSLYAKLQSHLGDPNAAYLLMRTAYERLPKDSPLLDKFYKNLYSAKAEVDLACLNGGSSNCSYRDQDGNPYIKDKNGKYIASKPWRRFKLNVKRKVNWENQK